MKLYIEVDLNKEIIDNALTEGLLKRDSPESTAAFRDKLEIMLRLRLRNAAEILGNWNFMIDHKEAVEYLNGL
jgi:hypothetical protein